MLFKLHRVYNICRERWYSKCQRYWVSAYKPRYSVSLTASRVSIYSTRGYRGNTEDLDTAGWIFRIVREGCCGGTTPLSLREERRGIIALYSGASRQQVFSTPPPLSFFTFRSSSVVLSSRLSRQLHPGSPYFTGDALVYLFVLTRLPPQ